MSIVLWSSRTRARWIGAFVATLLVATACGGSSGSGSGSSTLRSFLRQEYPGIILELPNYVGIQQGFFAKHGLNFELVPIGTGTAAAAALVSGSVDSIGQAPTFFERFNAQNPSQRVVQINTMFNGFAYYLIGNASLVGNCSDAQQPYPAPLKCLRGHKIGVTALGSDMYNTMVALMGSVGIGSNDATILAVGGATPQIAAFRTGQVDYVLVNEPARTQMLDVLHLGMQLTDLGKTPAFANWIAQASFALKSHVDANPTLYADYNAGLVDAMKFMADPANEDQVISAFRSHIEETTANLKALFEAHRDAMLTPSTDCKAITAVGAWLVDTKQLTTDQVQACSDFLWSRAPRT